MKGNSSSRLKWSVRIIVMFILVTGCGVCFWVFGHTSKSDPKVQGNEPSLLNNLPPVSIPENKSAQSDLSELPMTLSSAIDNNTKNEAELEIVKAEYPSKLAKIRETIALLNKDFEGVTFSEIPQSFRLKMQPKTDLSVRGRLIRYVTDESNNIIIDNSMNIMDYGEFSTTIAEPSQQGEFKQVLKFDQPVSYYLSDAFYMNNREVPKSIEYEWTDTGVSKYVQQPDEKTSLRLFPACLEPFYNKKLSKGDIARIPTGSPGNEKEFTHEVLGYAEIEGHKTIVFEERAEFNTPMQDAPPIKREIANRLYLDIETSMPFRSEQHATWHYTDAHRALPQFASIPQSGIQQIVYIYQIQP